MNTRVHYIYRDVSNYKLPCDVVLKGILPLWQMSAFNNSYEEMEFYPASLGFPAPTFQTQGYKAYDDDPDCHEFGYIEYSDSEADVDMTIKDFVREMGLLPGAPIKKATEIEWDTDGNDEILENLPKEVDIPLWVVSEEIASYLSDTYEWLVKSFVVRTKLEGLEAVKEKPVETQTDVIYTHDEAARLLDMFEEVLSRYDIHVPSPEDDEREEDNMVGLYGTTYGDLLDEVEDALIGIINRTRKGAELKTCEFSGNY